MKIKPEHVEYIRQAIEPFNTEANKQAYKANGYSEKRYRWDLTYAAKLSKWLCDNVYTYANDDHIDTVLRKLTNTK